MIQNTLAPSTFAILDYHRFEIFPKLLYLRFVFVLLDLHVSEVVDDWCVRTAGFMRGFPGKEPVTGRGCVHEGEAGHG